MLTKALMKGPTMLQALINLGGMKKVWTAACLVVVAWLGLGLATILAGKELKETMVIRVANVVADHNDLLTQ